MTAKVLMVGVYCERLRQNRSNISAKSGSFPSDYSRLSSGFRPSAPQNGVPSNIVHHVRELKNESYCAVFTLHVFRGRDRRDVGVPVDTQG